MLSLPHFYFYFKHVQPTVTVTMGITVPPRDYVKNKHTAVMVTEVGTFQWMIPAHTPPIARASVMLIVVRGNTVLSMMSILHVKKVYSSLFFYLADPLPTTTRNAIQSKKNIVFLSAW